MARPASFFPTENLALDVECGQDIDSMRQKIRLNIITIKISCTGPLSDSRVTLGDTVKEPHEQRSRDHVNVDVLSLFFQFVTFLFGTMITFK